MRYVDAYWKGFEKCVRDGIANAIEAKSSYFSIGWLDYPYLARVYNVYYQYGTSGCAIEAGIPVPEFPFEEINNLLTREPRAVPFFPETLESENWHEDIFGCEAGEWFALMLDDTITSIELHNKTNVCTQSGRVQPL